MTMQEVNGLAPLEFVERVGWVFEHTPWVAERALAGRPYATLSDLHAAMWQKVQSATREEQLALLRAHPDLGARARMSDASQGEQAGAGLDRLTAEEFARLQAANAAYREKFGFPFLFAVKGSTKHDILESIERRVYGDWETEFATALEQVFRIAGFRLADTIQQE
ncbi:MAG: 2-oxo-4-hydroxy-4-carboxy-5-ureidoimidazoline decarboxylase [Bryobacteraceae bacterium]|nr:2-oxo-4-hydroxy-4-carboxy-5-ureidoimidazoline decarboxylase [Bryobacteraceae bacterium]